MTERLTNWAGNLTFRPRRMHRPTSVDELRRIVAGSSTCRVLGTGHSFSPVADTRGDLISVADLPERVEIADDGTTVTVSAGTRYGVVASILHAAGFALHNLGSLPHIAVAGACSTGTHGSGDGNGVLGTAVRSLELVTATGDLAQPAADELPGAVVALGSLGVVTTVTLAIEPTYDVAQTVYEDLPLDVALDHLDDVLGAGYSVSLFTTWREASFDQVWVKRRLVGAGGRDQEPADLLGVHPAFVPRNPVPGMSPEHCTPQLGEPGPWHERLPHFRLAFTPSSGEELQSEYLVPRRLAVQALEAVAGLRAQIAPLLQVGEVRSIASDGLWLSPAYGRDSVGLHFTWVPDGAAVAPVLAELEERLADLGARPHWGKVFSTPPDAVAALYPRLDDARRLAERYDPDGVFRNDFTDTYLPTTPS